MNSLINFIKIRLAAFNIAKMELESKFEIISHEENYENTGLIYAKIRVKGIRKTFYKSVSELYQKTWIEDFSREDAAFIAILFLAEQRKDPGLISLFPTRKQYITKNVIFLGMVFVSFLILSNLTAFKLVEYHTNFFHLFGDINLTFPAALIFFPLTYFFDDTLTEVYGFKVSRFIIWSGLICNTIISLGVLVSTQLHASPYWPYQTEYEIVFNSTFRIFLASTIGYFTGEFCNSIILSKIKIMTSGRWLWLRIITSTSVAVGIDSMIFCNFAFTGIFPQHVIWKMVITQYLFKVGYELIALPLTYLITDYLKKKDNVDYYDYSTRYNPFSLKLDA